MSELTDVSENFINVLGPFINETPVLAAQNGQLAALQEYFCAPRHRSFCEYMSSSGAEVTKMKHPQAATIEFNIKRTAGKMAPCNKVEWEVCAIMGDARSKTRLACICAAAARGHLETTLWLISTECDSKFAEDDHKHDVAKQLFISCDVPRVFRHEEFMKAMGIGGNLELFKQFEAMFLSTFEYCRHGDSEIDPLSLGNVLRHACSNGHSELAVHIATKLWNFHWAEAPRVLQKLSGAGWAGYPEVIDAVLDVLPLKLGMLEVLLAPKSTLQSKGSSAYMCENAPRISKMIAGYLQDLYLACTNSVHGDEVVEAELMRVAARVRLLFVECVRIGNCQG